MKTKILLLITCLLLCLSCKNTSESQGDNEGVSSEVIVEDSNKTIDDTVEIDFDDATAQLQISSEAIRKMVENGQLDEAQAEEMIAKMEQVLGADNLDGFDTKTYGDSLSNVLGDLEASLNNPETTTSSTDVNTFQPRVFRSEKERGVENLRKVMNEDHPFFIEEFLKGWFGYSREKRKQAFRQLSSESLTIEDADATLLEFFEIDKAELELLKQLPAAEKIASESEARQLRDLQFSADLSAYMKSGKASEKFKALMDRFELLRKRTHRSFLQKSKKAREEFNKVNPGWYADTSESGDTYIDSHRNFIHLPLGALSFADRLVSHEMKVKNGNYPEGAVGIPDMVVEDLKNAHPKVCNLGTRGVLILEFSDNAIVDVNGPDLYVFEMGAIEPTNLEISKDGEHWIEVGKIEGGTAMVDIGPFVKPKETFNYIRLTDLVTSSTLPGADVDAVAAIGGALRLNLDSAVLFDTGKFKLKESASEALEKLLEDIQEIPSGTIIIEGHTDNVGDPKSNKTLSVNRAKEVTNYLKENLSKQYKFVEKGLGESQPIAPNDSEENKQKNRRVEILVMPSK